MTTQERDENCSDSPSTISLEPGPVDATSSKGAVASSLPSAAAGQDSTLKMEVICRLEVTDMGRMAAIERSARSLMIQILKPKSEPRPVWHIQEAVWPELGLPEFQDTQIQTVQLTLWPLSRIGQMEGKSGSLVLIGFFSTADVPNRHSNPLVIKTLDSAKSTKLSDEYKNALSIKPFAYDRKDDFAIPVFFDEAQSGYQILWSICSVSSPITVELVEDVAVPAIKIDDLRKPLLGNQIELIQKAIDAVFSLLSGLHRRFGMHSNPKTKVAQEYVKYLRNMWDGDGEKWGKKWQEVWGTRDKQFIADTGDEAINPLWALDKLMAMEYPMRMGAIHGDLHPGNIIIRGDKPPTIIDFGWARHKAHIAKDFVLLECNLRFLTLQTELRTESIESFASWVAWDAAPPADLGKYLDKRVKLIKLLRNKAAEVFPKETNWDEEYIGPLFVAAVGLLRFGAQLGNQHAAIRFVEFTAKYLNQKFDWKANGST